MAAEMIVVVVTAAAAVAIVVAAVVVIAETWHAALVSIHVVWMTSPHTLPLQLLPLLLFLPYTPATTTTTRTTTCNVTIALSVIVVSARTFTRLFDISIITAPGAWHRPPAERRELKRARMSL